jgi:hypothetical protein
MKELGFTYQAIGRGSNNHYSVISNEVEQVLAQ